MYVPSTRVRRSLLYEETADALASAVNGCVLISPRVERNIGGANQPQRHILVQGRRNPTGLGRATGSSSLDHSRAEHPERLPCDCVCRFVPAPGTPPGRHTTPESLFGTGVPLSLRGRRGSLSPLQEAEDFMFEVLELPGGRNRLSEAARTQLVRSRQPQLGRLSASASNPGCSPSLEPGGAACHGRAAQDPDRVAGGAARESLTRAP